MTKKVATPPVEPPAIPKSAAVAVEVTLPVLEHGKVCLRRIDIDNLSPRQSRALRFLFDGLVAEGESLRMAGTMMDRVATQADAVRWLFDKIADAAFGADA